MIRKKKLFSRPRKAFEKTRITEENKLLEKYGLKNKKEVWKAVAGIKYFRRRAMDLAKSTDKEQAQFFNKLKHIGLKVDSIADVLALKVENILERRLPSVLTKLGLTNTTRQARQFVVHRKVLVNGNVVTVPSYIVPVSEEKSITLRVSLPTPTPQSNEINSEKQEEVKEAENNVQG